MLFIKYQFETSSRHAVAEKKTKQNKTKHVYVVDQHLDKTVGFINGDIAICYIICSHQVDVAIRQDKIPL